MVSEIDVMSVNVNVADLLMISKTHFNAIESQLFAALNFDVGISEEQFQTRFKKIDDECGD